MEKSEALRIFAKCKAVVESCETVGQYVTAIKFVKLARPALETLSNSKELIEELRYMNVMKLGALNNMSKKDSQILYMSWRKHIPENHLTL